MKCAIYLAVFFSVFSCGKLNCPEPIDSHLNSTTQTPPTPTIPTTPTTPTDNSLAKALIASYSFCGDANDGSGNNINGILHGNPALSKDRFGNDNQAYYFDGVDDYIDIYNPLLFNSTEWTYSAWVNVTTNPLEGSIAFIIGIGGGGSGGAQDLLINNQYVTPSQGFTTNSYHSIGNTPSQSITGTLPIVNTWYHVVGIRETDTVRVFINGIQIAKTKTLSTALSYGTSSSAYIGSRAAGTNLFNGYLDDIRIYSRALSITEVQDLYTTNVTCTEQTTLRIGLLARYDFCGNANDGSGNNINGNINGGATLSADRFGNANSAYYFDGVDDYIDIYDPLLFKSTQWTYSAWVNVTKNPDPGEISFIIGIGGGGSGGAQDLMINNQYVIPYQGFQTNSYEVAGVSVSYSISGTLPITDTWYHVVAIRKLDTVRIYVDGVEIAKNKTSLSDITFGTASSAFIGCRAAGTRLFNGYLDDIRIYSRPLTADEIKELYTSTKTCAAIQSPGLLLAYNDFNSDAKDTNGKNSTAILYGGVTGNHLKDGNIAYFSDDINDYMDIVKSKLFTSVPAMNSVLLADIK